MKKWAIKFLCFATVLIFTGHVFAQKSVIRGRITDDKGNAAGNVTVKLLNEDSSLRSIIQTDSNGFYKLADIRKGKYFIEATAIGMKKSTTSAFVFDGKTLVIPDLVLKTDVAELKEITVKGEKRLLENKNGKIIYNVDKSISATGTSAFDQLRRAPGISVDQADHLVLKGNDNINVMIDGKPTYLSAEQLTIMLKSIPAENLKSIEIIPIPSSQYDAAGNAGIVNLITKKSTQRGYALNVSAGVGTGRYMQTIENIAGNVKTKYFNIFGNLSYSYNHSYLNRTSHRVVGNTVYDRVSYDPSISSNIGYKAGVDIYINKTNQIGFAYNGYSNHWSRDASGPTYLSDLNDRIDSIVINHNVTHEPSDNNSYNLNYILKIDTLGSTFSADADYAQYINDSYGTQGNQFFDKTGIPLQAFQQLRLQQPSIITIRSFNTDASFLFGKVKINAGLKYAHVTTDNDFTYDSLINNQYVKSNTLSNHFIYTEKVGAIYFSGNREWKTITAYAGLRVEHTNSVGDLVDKDIVTKRRYADFFPFISFDKILNKNHKINLSVSRRINRPVYNNLNPSRYFFDKYSYYEGNPNLKPEYTWTAALQYSFKNAYSVTLSCSRTNNAMLGFALQDSNTGELKVSTLNFSYKDYYDMLFIIPVSIGQFWEMQNTADLIYTSYSLLQQKPVLNAHKFIADISTIHTFKLPAKISLELTAQYTSPSLDGVYINKYYFTLNGGIKKLLLKNKLDVKISFTDLFKNIHYWGYSIYDGANVRYNHTTDSRRININFSYHFGGKLSSGKTHRLEEQDRI